MKNNNKQTNKRHADQNRNKVVALQAAWLQVKIKFRLILNFIHLLSLIIHELGLGGKENLELTYSVGQKILTWI